MPSGGRPWAFRYQRNGIVKKMGLGSAKAAGLKLSGAKDRAIDALRLLAKETDPEEQRDDEKRRAQASWISGALRSPLSSGRPSRLPPNPSLSSSNNPRARRIDGLACRKS
jgi:hypothetical protein